MLLLFQNKRKIPTDPPERISRITNTHPKHPDSPFYGPNPIKPLATLTLTKIKEVCGSDEGSQSVDDVVPSTEDLVNIMKKKMMLTKKLGRFFQALRLLKISIFLLKMFSSEKKKLDSFSNTLVFQGKLQ